MTIKEVEKKLNISRANIRFYEKEGLLEPKRNDNEYRNYSEDDIKRLEKILLFRKCNVSIEDIHLIFNGTKTIEEVFLHQISIIENELKQLEGAKIMCKKLAYEKSSIDKINTSKYIDIINNEEEKGNKFYNITEDYILANEKLYQSIIESNCFKGGDKMKKGIKIGIYIISFVFTTLLLGLFDYILVDKINWEDAIIFVAIFTIIDFIGVKKYIEKKDGKKFTKKDNMNHFIIIVIIMVVSLLGYLTIKAIYEVKNNQIFVYVVANYGIINKDDCKVIDEVKNTFTMIYDNKKNSNGIYELKEYKENSIPDNLKDKANVNYDDNYFKSQINSYCNK